MNKQAIESTKLHVFGEVVTLRVDKYQQGETTAILGICETGETVGVLTVNVPGTPLAEDEVIIKNWSENERFAEAAFASGLFTDTGRTVRTGYVEAPIWRVN